MFINSLYSDSWDKGVLWRNILATLNNKLLYLCLPLPAGGGGGGCAGSGRTDGAGGGGNTGDSSTSPSCGGGGGGNTSDDVIESPFDIGDTPFIEVDITFDVMDPFIELVITGGRGRDGCMMLWRGNEDGGGGGIASEGAPSGLRCASVCDLLSSFISAASTCSSCERKERLFINQLQPIVHSTAGMPTVPLSKADRVFFFTPRWFTTGW